MTAPCVPSLDLPFFGKIVTRITLPKFLREVTSVAMVEVEVGFRGENGRFLREYLLRSENKKRMKEITMFYN